VNKPLLLLFFIKKKEKKKKTDRLKGQTELPLYDRYTPVKTEVLEYHTSE